MKSMLRNMFIIVGTATLTACSMFSSTTETASTQSAAPRRQMILCRANRWPGGYHSE